MEAPVIPDSLRALFERYRDAVNTFDPGQIAAHFTVPAAITDAGGPQVFGSIGALTAKLTAYCDHFHQIGYVDAEFEVGHFRPLGPTSAVVDLGWRIETTGDPVAFRSIYLCQKVEGQWRIFAAEAYKPA